MHHVRFALGVNASVMVPVAVTRRFSREVPRPRSRSHGYCPVSVGPAPVAHDPVRYARHLRRTGPADRERPVQLGSVSPASNSLIEDWVHVGIRVWLASQGVQSGDESASLFAPAYERRRTSPEWRLTKRAFIELRRHHAREELDHAAVEGRLVPVRRVV
ncbi:hypothetical protein GCM10010317_093160 [Streptomyces mirabilis]|nr:hypothetical protein GCM10010317_093160 [Streptomyces mirabilis]